MKKSKKVLINVTKKVLPYIVSVHGRVNVDYFYPSIKISDDDGCDNNGRDLGGCDLGGCNGCSF